MKLLVAGYVMLFLCVPLLFAYNYLWRNYKSEQFVDHWSSQFLKCRDLKTITKSFPDIYIREFEDGKWVAAAVEWSCTSGAGYDVSVFYDSTGAIRFNKGYNFCGYEGLHGELNRIEAKTLQDFYSRLAYLKLEAPPVKLPTS